MHNNIVFMMFLQGLLQILLCNKDWSWTGPLNSSFYAFSTCIFAMCCFSYISMVMSGNVYCSTHAYCVLHGIIQHIYKVFHQLKQCIASYNQLRPVLHKTGLDWSRDHLDWSWSWSLPKKEKTGLDWTFKP